MNKFIRAIAFLNPLRELFRLFQEIEERTSTRFYSQEGFDIINNPELREEMEIQIQEWKDSGAFGPCIVNLNKKHYKREFLLERISKS